MKDLKLYYEFEADVLVLHHPTTIQVNYEPTIHCGTVTQTAKICSMETDTMDLVIGLRLNSDLYIDPNI